MPRRSRIDAPGALHHIIVRGIERKSIFKDDADRDNFLERLKNIGAFLRQCLNSEINYTTSRDLIDVKDY